MSHPWPEAPIRDESGAIIKSTTPTDLQKIVAAQFEAPGMLGDIEVNGTSRMEYEVKGGVVMLWKAGSSGKLGLLIPVPETTVSTPDAPSTGSRLESIYVTPEGEVGRVTGTTIPAGGITLRRFNIKAGTTSTDGAEVVMDRNYAIPYGASMGMLYSYHDPRNDVLGKSGDEVPARGSFRVASDRYVRFDLTHCLSAVQASPSDQPSVGIRWRIYVDDELELAFTTRVTRATPQTNFMSFTKYVTAGEHRVHYVQDQIEGLSGPGWKYHKGTNQGYPGMRFEVWDAGVAR